MHEAGPGPGARSFATIAHTLAPLYPLERDPRVSWLPAAPDAAEAHLRAAGRCDLVAGYVGRRITEVDAFVARCVEHAAREGAGDHRDTWRRWRAAAGGEILDSGVQLSAELTRLQVYLRGHFGPDAIDRAFAAIEVAVSRRAVRNALALLARPAVEMIGLELRGARVGGAVYLAVPNRDARDAAAIDDAIALLIAAVLPGTEALPAWRAIGASLLAASGPEWIYVSFEPAEQPTWVKIDVGVRALALAGVVVARVQPAARAMCERAAAHGFDPLAHIGVRFDRTGPDVSLYHSLQ